MINLHYIRAAIEANTGKRLSLEEVRTLLVEEGLITQKRADRDAVIFRGYNEFFWSDGFGREADGEIDDEEGLPDNYVPGS